MKKLIFPALFFFLNGCAMTDYMDSGLRALSGKKIDTAFNVLGYPENKQVFDGTTVYTWHKRLNTLRNYTTPQDTYGTIGKETFRVTVTETQYVPVTVSCKVQIAVDKRGYIKNYSYDDDGACDTYSLRLEKYLATAVTAG